MTHQSAFSDVQRAVADFGPRATIVTVGDGLRPHIVTAMVSVEGDRLLVGVGARTRANVTARPDLALVWNPPAGGEYQLILDGTVERIDDPGATGASMLRIAVAGGILHRLAGLPEDAPSCKSLSEHAAC